MANTRFSNTILYDRGGSLKKWGLDLPQGRMSPDYVTVFDDFTGVVIDATNDWTVVKDSSAAVALVADTAGGEVVLTSQTTTNDDGASIQGNEIFLPAAGRTIWFETRIKVADADQQDVFVGICENFATDPEACLTASNRIGLQITDEDASILCKSEVADAETSTDSAIDAVDATYIRLGFKVSGISQIQFFVNRELVATHTTVPATEMAPAIFSLSGNASGTKSLTADYIMCVATR
jgi:hypothetical protein